MTSLPLAFEIRESAVAGKGGFATRAIAKGERIIEYVGERITHEEADRRYDDESMDVHHTFLFSVSSRTVIDASHGGNEARYLNHSCDPNCEAEISRGRVFISALRDIAVNEELCYDYAYQRSGDETEADEVLYQCRCGATGCRGSIMEPIEALKERKKATKATKRTTRPEATRAPRQRQGA